MQYFYVAPNLVSNLAIIIKTACFQNQQDYLVRKKTTMFLSTLGPEGIISFSVLEYATTLKRSRLPYAAAVD